MTPGPSETTGENTMKKISVFLLALAFVAPSCGKWQDPSTSMVSADKSIAVLLLNPSVYSMQEVRVKGKVWDMLSSEERGEPTVFKLADSDGNYIKVTWSGETPLAEGDIIEAEGLFDNNYVSSESRFDPTLAAKKIRVLRSESR